MLRVSVLNLPQHGQRHLKATEYFKKNSDWCSTGSEWVPQGRAVQGQKSRQQHLPQPDPSQRWKQNQLDNLSHITHIFLQQPMGCCSRFSLGGHRAVQQHKAPSGRAQGRLRCFLTSGSQPRCQTLKSLSQRRKCQHQGLFSPIPNKNTTATMELHGQKRDRHKDIPQPLPAEKSWIPHWGEVEESGTKATEGWKKTGFELTRPKQ